MVQAKDCSGVLHAGAALVDVAGTTELDSVEVIDEDRAAAVDDNGSSIGVGLVEDGGDPLDKGEADDSGGSLDEAVIDDESATLKVDRIGVVTIDEVERTCDDAKLGIDGLEIAIEALLEVIELTPEIGLVKFGWDDGLLDDTEDVDCDCDEEVAELILEMELVEAGCNEKLLDKIEEVCCDEIVTGVAFEIATLEPGCDRRLIDKIEDVVCVEEGLIIWVDSVVLELEMIVEETFELGAGAVEGDDEDTTELGLEETEDAFGYTTGVELGTIGDVRGELLEEALFVVDNVAIIEAAEDLAVVCIVLDVVGKLVVTLTETYIVH